MTSYVTLIEHNEHEGETWRFYIPWEGNEDAIGDLETALSVFTVAWQSGSDADPPPFELVLDPLDATEVDTLVKSSDIGYMHDHNMLEGRLVLDAGHLEALAEGDPDPLYKGRIRDHMKATA